MVSAGELCEYCGCEGGGFSGFLFAVVDERAQRVEVVGLLPGGAAFSVSEWVVRRVASRSMLIRASSSAGEVFRPGEGCGQHQTCDPFGMVHRSCHRHGSAQAQAHNRERAEAGLCVSTTAGPSPSPSRPGSGSQTMPRTGQDTVTAGLIVRLAWRRGPAGTGLPRGR